ncbi:MULTISPECIES: hypothetical protein [Halobacterium]|uniref:hypothetical protein n=1 Tax=Halobacterium TaxID=2239 RepID=UPI00073E2136|nr:MULTISPECIES: hypothetical protein [Halobacterium]MCG1004366.1 hypothetical protein [Halobacterium noricense]
MSARARRAAVLALLAAVLLVNPLYVPHLADDGDSRSANVYSTTAVDPADASGQATIIRALGDDGVVETTSLTGEYAAQSDEYRASSPAAVVLERAIESGNASTNDTDTAFTLHRIAANHRYVVTDRDAAPPYYRIGVNATDNTTTVSATAVDRETVARHLVHRDAVLYTSLSDRQRDAFDATVADPQGHRPAETGLLDDLTGRVVVKDGTYYVLRHEGHVDSISLSPGGGLTFLLYGLGMFAFLAAFLLTVRSYWTAREN